MQKSKKGRADQETLKEAHLGSKMEGAKKRQFKEKLSL